jgi:uncharacterized RDD family membrane protein YckC
MALAIDGLCLGLPGIILGFFFFDSLARLGVWGRLLGFSIAMVYFGILNSAIGKGKTIGKRIMKIEVVDRAGNHLSVGRSFLRYAILGAPMFLNYAMIPPDVLLSPIGYLIGFILFGVGGGIIYLYVCNRRTRQSLHDLAVGSFVVKTTPEGQVVDSMWRPHMIFVGIWLLAVVGITIVMTTLSKKGMIQELLAVQREIQSSCKVHMATATIGKSWRVFDGKRLETTYFESNVTWKERPLDDDAAVQQVASVILRNYADIMKKDVLVVTTTYGYDIGFARSWRTQQVQHSPSEWQGILGKSPVKQ